MLFAATAMSFAFERSFEVDSLTPVLAIGETPSINVGNAAKES